MSVPPAQIDEGPLILETIGTINKMRPFGLFKRPAAEDRGSMVPDLDNVDDRVKARGPQGHKIGKVDYHDVIGCNIDHDREYAPVRNHTGGGKMAQKTDLSEWRKIRDVHDDFLAIRYDDVDISIERKDFEYIDEGKPLLIPDRPSHQLPRTRDKFRRSIAQVLAKVKLTKWHLSFSTRQEHKRYKTV